VAFQIAGQRVRTARTRYAKRDYSASSFPPQQGVAFLLQSPFGIRGEDTCLSIVGEAVFGVTGRLEPQFARSTRVT
jgi:hypothetical protein